VIHGLACGQHPLVLRALAPDGAMTQGNHKPCGFCQAQGRVPAPVVDVEHLLLYCPTTGAAPLEAGAPYSPQHRAKQLYELLSTPRALLEKLCALSLLEGAVLEYIRPREPD